MCEHGLYAARCFVKILNSRILSDFTVPTGTAERSVTNAGAEAA
jgi:hypothetical protein